MKNYVLELASKQSGINAKLNIMREYLQAYALRILYDQGFFRSTAFLGGTALRFLYNLPRFSEDLDFSLVANIKYSFVDIIGKVKEEFLLAGYNISVFYNDKKSVNHAFLRFSELMYEAEISPLKSQNLSIKIEVDMNSPKEAEVRTDIVNKFFPISFLSYDLSSLFAGKLHALLSRKYTKGRDFFDLGWYLSRWKDIRPNFRLLNNALLQTGWKDGVLSENDWRDFIYKIVASADWTKVKKDVENFLENPSDLNIFSQENILKLLSEK